MSASIEPYDAVLLQSFGGPQSPDEVMPFLRNVVRGRAVPQERLAEVAEHYFHRDGRSPINDANRALQAALREELARRGIEVEVWWGNRNWHPFLADTLRSAHAAGARRVVSVVTSAYSSYSGCRQYWDDLDAAASTLREQDSAAGELVVERIRPYFNHPGFVDANARAVAAAASALAARIGAPPHVAFVTHSIPLTMNEQSGPEGNAYVSQHRAVAEAVMAQLAQPLAWDLVYCSRSGPASQPWLEPDVNDHLRDLAARGVSGVVVAPIGFISDHMEVVHDLDTEAAETADELGLAMIRAATVGSDPGFVAGLVELILERAEQARGGVEAFSPSVTTSMGPLPVPCRAGCCPAPRRPASPAAEPSPDANHVTS